MFLSRLVSTFFVISTISILSVACTTAGNKEFQLYSQAYDAQYIQADSILRVVAEAERQYWSRSQPRVNRGGYFDPNDAAYYIDTIEPPKTAAIRASLLVVKNYNQAMIALASGENAKALSAKVSTLTVNVASAAVAVAALASPTATAAQIAASNTVRFAKSMTSYLGYLPIATEVLNISSREAFRKQLIASYPTIAKILLTLRNQATPLMYEVMRSGADNGQDTAAPKPNAEAKKLLAGWVLLLDKTILTLDSAVNAAKTGTQIDLDSLSQTSLELTVLAEQVRAAKLQK